MARPLRVSRAGATPAWAKRAWVLLEDCLYRALRCSPVERTLYNHLLRHTLLEGRRVVRRTKLQLSRATGICPTAVRDNLRSLQAKSCLRICERAQGGLLIEVCWPGNDNLTAETQRTHRKEMEIQDSRCKIQTRNQAGGRSFSSDNKLVPQNYCSAKGLTSRFAEQNESGVGCRNVGAEAPTPCYHYSPNKLVHCLTDTAIPYEALSRRRPAKNPFKSARFRQAIRRRDGGRCFYCQRRLPAGNWGLDHIVSRAQEGRHTADNAAACCGDCNREKGEQGAAEFLASLHGRGHLDASQLAQRLRALAALRNTGL